MSYSRGKDPAEHNIESARPSYSRIEIELKIVNNEERYMWADRTDWRGSFGFVALLF